MAFAAICMGACEQVSGLEEKLENTASIVIAEGQETDIDIAPKGETISIKFKSTLEWNTEYKTSISADDWFHMIPDSGKGGDSVCKIKVDKNESGKKRSVSIYVISKDAKEEFKLTQKSLEINNDEEEEEEENGGGEGNGNEGENEDGNENENGDGNGEGENEEEVIPDPEWPDDSQDPNATTVSEILAIGVGKALPQNSYISVYVISDKDLGNLTSLKNTYVQDQTGGLMIRFTENHSYNRGDLLKVNISGKSLEDYQGTIQLNNVPLDDAEVISSGNEVPYKTVSITDFLANKYSGQYIALDNIQVSDSDLGKTFVSNSSHTSINMEDDKGNKFIVFSSKFSSFGSETVPQGAGKLKGIAAINNGNIQIIFSKSDDWAGLTGPRHGEDNNEDEDTEEDRTPTGESGKYDWFELPEFGYTQSGNYMIDATDSDLYYAHHICAGGERGPGGKTARNYTVCFSAEHHCPVWVAAPRHSMYESGASRTDAYGKDPNIPSDIQYNSKSTGGGCNKGHMLGSAERLSTTATNKQVFYYTNIAPQYSDTFNTGGGAWNTLEDWVDGQVCSDTLYVVIGAYFDNYTDKRGNSASPKKISFGGRSDVSCPTMFYYILMRTKSGNSGKSLSQCKASEIKCAAFVRSHNTAKGTSVSSQDLMSVSDLEKETGFTYFPNVPHAPKSTCSASDWGL